MDALTSPCEEIVRELVQFEEGWIERISGIQLSATTGRAGEPFFSPREEPSAGRRVGRWRILIWIGAAILAIVVGAVIAAPVAAAIRAHRREQCANQLKAIGVALNAYHEAQGHFPAPAVAGKHGTPLLSWRVAILPFLGYQSLYERFHLDEPWDSAHNLSLLAEMPAEYACPAGPGRNSAKTGYLVIVGPSTQYGSVNTPFEDGRGVDMREVTDGTSNTILVIESGFPVPWTKPDDLRWARGGPLPPLSSPHQGGTHGLLVDGSTRFFKDTMSPTILLAILTINGGEVLGSS
jgi:hypothetical protein